MMTLSGVTLTLTRTVQSAVWGVGSLFEYRIVTLYVPAAVVFATLRVAVKVPPTPPAGVILLSVIPVTGVLMIFALVTVPSGSVALTFADVGTPCVVLREP